MTGSRHVLVEGEEAPQRRRNKSDVIMAFVIFPLTAIICIVTVVATLHWGQGWEHSKSLIAENYQVTEVRPGPRGGVSTLTVVVGGTLHVCKRIPDEELIAKKTFTCADGWVVHPK